MKKGDETVAFFHLHDILTYNNMSKLKKTYDLKVKTLRQFFKTPKRWIQGDWDNTECTACCISGALNRVYDDSALKRDDVEKQIGNSIRRFYSKVLKKKAPTFISLINFNDAPRRKFEHIRWVIEDAGV